MRRSPDARTQAALSVLLKRGSYILAILSLDSGRILSLAEQSFHGPFVLKEILPGPELSVKCFRPVEPSQSLPCQNRPAGKDQSARLGNIGLFKDVK